MHSNPHSIPITEIQLCLKVDPTSSTGLRRLITTSSNAVVGSEAGSLNVKTGYYQTTFNGKRYANSRIVYALYHNIDPGIMLVDHIDGNRKNNHPNNLRLVTNRQNHMNRVNQGIWPVGVKCRPSLTLGPRFHATIKISGKFKHLGVYSDPESASAAYQKALKDLENADQTSKSTHLEVGDE